MADIDAQEHSGRSVRVRTLADLAKIAGVSPGTVSRALAGNSLVNTKTREKIEAIAREHGFRPNQMASKLRRQKTGVIGVAIPLGHAVRQQISDTFFMTLLGHLADELTEKGYDLMLRRVIPAQDEDWLDRFIGSGMVDGVIVIGQSDQFERIEEVADGYLPMVVWGNHQEGQRHCVVGTDNRLGGKLAVERLIASGAKKLAFLGDTQPIEFAARFAGAKEVAEKMGVTIRALPTHLSPERTGQEIAEHLHKIEGKVDGIFAATDTIAVAALKELRERGIDVPRQLKVIGFDDLPISSQTAPPLTTVKQDIAAGAKGLVDLLLRRLAGDDTESLVMPPHLIVRETA
ncbi:LacI family DNA-binding transcriptional regulator [Erythrobacter sp. SCSIO 43205]|uniref:LacI family DNA-binding transcriptional regulator n=1 Tax=Erythrobacter sp. SCSIO 43205 TaxID=2779361 RepID=UPI001CA862A8|nr:LacI family DNA-binding transcriptional regulator [Erythrobacter sp. SCSIO 43205]UAB79015.1 LacI family DNA-binding transcriptional regulator [Erythrobacter sp. SCSIO 43205]